MVLRAASAQTAAAPQNVVVLFDNEKGTIEVEADGALSMARSRPDAATAPFSIVTAINVATVTTVVVIVAAAATAFPAQWVARIEPMRVLRAD